jgi:hypothetical protein
MDNPSKPFAVDELERSVEHRISGDLAVPAWGGPRGGAVSRGWGHSVAPSLVVEALVAEAVSHRVGLTSTNRIDIRLA